MAHYPSKTEVMRRDRHRLTRSRPEAHGICSTTVAEMLTELENDPRVNLHSIVITKDGEVIAEASAPGYDASLPHLSHSMSKTVTGILIESLIDSGEVSKESLVCELLPEYKPRDRGGNERAARGKRV